MKALDYQPVKLEAESFYDKNISDIKQWTQLKRLNSNKISKLSWVNLSKEDFNSLIKDAADNLDKKDYKTTVDNGRYDLKNAETFCWK